MMKLIVCGLLIATPALAFFWPCSSGAPYPDTAAVTNCLPADPTCSFQVLENVSVNLTKLSPVATATLTWTAVTSTVLGIEFILNGLDRNACTRLAAPSSCPIAVDEIIDGRFNFEVLGILGGNRFEIEVSVRGASSELMCLKFDAEANLL